AARHRLGPGHPRPRHDRPVHLAPADLRRRAGHPDAGAPRGAVPQRPPPRRAAPRRGRSLGPRRAGLRGADAAGWVSEEPPMFHEKLRRVGDEYEVTIPDAEVERLGLQEGQWVSVEIWAAAGASELPPDARG